MPLFQSDVDNVLGPKVPPICATVLVEGQSLRMEDDTGAVYSVIGEAEFTRLFPGMALENSDLKLRGYFGHQSAVVGKATVIAKFGGKHARLPLFVVKGGSRAFLGKNWPKAFGMPLDSLLNVPSVNDVKNLVSRFPYVFSEGLGNFAGVKAKIRVPEDATPHFSGRDQYH
ncbi:uncharacterized protein [Dermacentor albipictus]|uniref:uncharacterized protein n=1 Tax=Dermacentor albipictus TaxID=60249 RepID=UPI0038FC2D23